MKKILLLTLMMVGLAFNAMGQTVTVDSLRKAPLGLRANLVMDFSKAIIHEMSEENFAKHEKDWERDKPSIVEKFRAAANVKLDNEMKLGYYDDAEYQMTVTVKSITTKGFIVCDAVLTNKDGKVFFAVEDLKGSSDSFFTPGTKLARIKFWAALTGVALGSVIKGRM